jgi:hypothetical protein
MSRYIIVFWFGGRSDRTDEAAAVTIRGMHVLMIGGGGLIGSHLGHSASSDFAEGLRRTLEHAVEARRTAAVPAR